MSVATDVHVAAQAVCEDLRRDLIGLTMAFGLPSSIANTVRLEWDGTMFRAQADSRVREYEYGDGKNPPGAPLRKAMNRLQPRLMDALERRLSEAPSLLPEVAF